MAEPNNGNEMSDAIEKLDEIKKVMGKSPVQLLTEQVKQEVEDNMANVINKMAKLEERMGQLEITKQEMIQKKLQKELEPIQEEKQLVTKKITEILPRAKDVEQKIKNKDQNEEHLKKQVKNVKEEVKKIESKEKIVQEKLQQLQTQIQSLQQEKEYAKEVKNEACTIKARAEELKKREGKDHKPKEQEGEERGLEEQQQQGGERREEQEKLQLIIDKARKIRKEIQEIHQDARNAEQKEGKEWDEYYMKIACLAALRSKDPRTPVGACIVDKKGQIVGIGYNSMPMDKDLFTWKGAKDKKDKRDEKDFINPKLKYAYVVHAAVNAIINKTNESIEDCTLYTTLHPDDDCAHAIIQAGIKEVVYCMYTRHGSEWDDKMKIADVLFYMKGIQARELPSDNLSKDKYAKELDKRIKKPEKHTHDDSERSTEPATAISWEKFFMRMAKICQKRPSSTLGNGATPVGACIVSPNKQIMAVGYSGNTESTEKEIKEKAKARHGLELTKIPEFFVHAEYRAIMGRPSVRGCTLYVTSYPCNVCARVIVQAGIDKVVHYKEGDWNDDRYYSSKEILKTCLGPNKIRKYGNGDSQDDSQDEHKGIIEGSGRTYIAKITTITDIQ